MADWIYLNGHGWAKRQLEIAGIGYEALDNGFRSCDAPTALQRICDRLGPEPVRYFDWQWFNRLPSPLTHADIHAGYGYELAFRQFEVSDTAVFDGVPRISWTESSSPGMPIPPTPRDAVSPSRLG